MPKPFEGVPRKDAKQWNTPAGEAYNLTGTLEQQWEDWNRAAELTVAKREDKQHLCYFGRGMEPNLVKNTVAAKQDSDGCAINKEIDEMQLYLNMTGRRNWLKDRGLVNLHEYQTLDKRTRDAEDSNENLRLPLEQIKARLADE